MRRHPSAGYTLLELLAALSLVAILASLAAPSLAEEVRRIRVRSTLDRVTADIYRARALAALRGSRLNLSFVPADGCARAYVITRHQDGATLDSVLLPSRARPCLTGNVPQAMSFDSRGMLIGSPRTIEARMGDQADSITISIAGRVLSW